MANSNVTIDALRRAARDELVKSGIDSADIDSKILMRAALNWTASDLIAKAQHLPSRAEIDRFSALLARRIKHEPIAYILGKQQFWTLEFKVTPDVLIPRPETEGVVEHALALINDIENPVIIDVGTGSGAILLSLLHERKDARGIGLDISAAALAVAQGNADILGLADRSEFVISDQLTEIDRRVHLVVSNPPYITEKAMEDLPRTVSEYEPALALRGGRDGLEAYNAIISNLSRVLVPGGIIVFEIGYDQGQAVARALDAAGFDNIKVDKDLAGHDRIVSGKLSV